jgi:hypothetical protein
MFAAQSPPESLVFGIVACTLVSELSLERVRVRPDSLRGANRLVMVENIGVRQAEENTWASLKTTP